MNSPGRRRILEGAAAAGLSFVLPACKPTPKDAIKSDDGAFAEAALRFDFRHSVTADSDAFELVRTRAEPKWGGRLDRLAQAPDWGAYRLTLDASGTPLFRVGFESAAQSQPPPSTTTLSVRSPLPRRTLRAVVEKRRAESIWQPVWSADLDPEQSSVDRSPPQLSTRVEPLLVNGPEASKVDLAILGDGYAAAEYGKFVGDAMRAMGHLFSVQPYAIRMRDFNVYSVFAPSAHSGVSDRFLGVQKQSVFGSTYFSGEAERTLAAANTAALHEAASATPYDFLLVLANSRRYGGSAHFGGPAVVAADSGALKYLVLHELGHVIGGLAEEYYLPAADGPAYRGNVEPWHPNVTLGADKGKWKDLAGASPRPVEWNKAEYEKQFATYVKRYESLRSARADEGAIEALMQEERTRQSTLLGKNARGIGLYEGAHGYAKGVFRSEPDCIMFSLQSDRFCTACTAALERMIEYHSR